MHASADDFCRMVSNTPDITNATARIGAWFIGAANQTGGFPLELSLAQIRLGFTKGGVHIPGTGSRNETLRASIDYLEKKGFMSSEEGRPQTGGFSSRKYSMHTTRGHIVRR